MSEIEGITEEEAENGTAELPIGCPEWCAKMIASRSAALSRNKELEDEKAALLTAFEERGKVLERIGSLDTTGEHSEWGAGYDAAVSEISEIAWTHLNQEKEDGAASLQAKTSQAKP